MHRKWFTNQEMSAHDFSHNTEVAIALLFCIWRCKLCRKRAHICSKNRGESERNFAQLCFGSLFSLSRVRKQCMFESVPFRRNKVKRVNVNLRCAFLNDCTPLFHSCCAKQLSSRHTVFADSIPSDDNFPTSWLSFPTDKK